MGIIMMNEAQQWRGRAGDLASELEEKTREFEKLQQKYYELEYNTSMQNINDKFEPIYAQPDISDADYPYMGKSRHSRQPAEGHRSINGQFLSETGYASELSELSDGLLGSSISQRGIKNLQNRNPQLQEQQRERGKEKVKHLQNLKIKATSLQNQIENQRAQLYENMADFSQNGKDDLAGIDDEIETQKKMLQQADDTLNQILEKMAADVHKLEDNNEFEPEIDGLKRFLKRQREKEQSKLKKLENENQHLTEENSKMKSSLKQGSKSSKEDIGKLKDKIKRLERQIIDKDRNNSNKE